MRPTRVVICTAAVGCGHTRAALAVREGILEREPGAQVEFIETLDYASPWFVRSYRDGYLAAVSRVPALAGWMYNATDRIGRSDGWLGRAVERRGLRRFCELPALKGADLVLTTHFLCARLLGGLKASAAISAPVGVCVTDVHPHAVWLARGTDVLMVASAASKQAAVRAGVDERRVVVTGIPIDRRFERREQKSAARAAMGLPAEGSRPVVLVAGGGLGLGGIEGVVERLMRCGRGVHVVVICGRNGALKQALTPLARDWRTAAAGEPSCQVEGFTTQMPCWMAAADLMVGKPGGLSTAEACASGLAMVLLRPIPGQEERNAQFLCAEGAAVLRVTDDAAALEAVALAFDGARLSTMGAASRRLGRPGAALAAAETALGLVDRAAMPASAEWGGDAAASDEALLSLPCVIG